MPNLKLERAIASWKTPYSEALWKRLEELKTNVKFDAGKGQEGNWLALGPTLPDDTEPRVARVVTRRNLGEGDHANQEPQLYWILTVAQAPDQDPPENVRAHDAKLGGRSGLMKLLAESAPASAPQVGTFQLRLLVREQDHRCKVLPLHVERGSVHGPAADLGRSVWLEQVGYRYEAGVSGLEEVSIVYLHTDQVFSVSTQANGSLKLSSPTWLPYADEVADLVLSAFFVAREEAGS